MICAAYLRLCVKRGVRQLPPATADRNAASDAEVGFRNGTGEGEGCPVTNVALLSGRCSGRDKVFVVALGCDVMVCFEVRVEELEKTIQHNKYKEMPRQL